MDEKKNFNLTNFILVALLVVAAFLVGKMWNEVSGLKQQMAQTATPTPLAQATPTGEQAAVLGEQLETTLGRFSVTKDEVCLEDGKPVIYYFGSTSCPHCQWEHPIIQRVVKKFAGQIVFHDNTDKQTADPEILQKYSQIQQGGIPFIVLGCKYARVGSGEDVGEKTEEENLTALICKLTDNQPEKICATE